MYFASLDIAIPDQFALLGIADPFNPVFIGDHVFANEDKSGFLNTIPYPTPVNPAAPVGPV